MKNKLVLASLALLVSAITLIAASYAWFTMNDTVSAIGLQLTAATPAIVEISLDGNTWGSSVTLPATSLAMRPTSTMTALDGSFYEPTVNTALVTENAEGIFKAIPNPSGITYQYYHDVDLYFRTKGTYPIDLILQNLSIEETDLNKAIRVAFLKSDGTAYSNGTTPLIYASTSDTYKAAASTDTIEDFTPLTAGASNVIINVPVNATNANQYGTTVNMKVRIYLEGQDPNCVVDNLLDSLSIGLTFAGAEVTS